jgi:hypothetical protein
MRRDTMTTRPQRYTTRYYHHTPIPSATARPMAFSRCTRGGQHTMTIRPPPLVPTRLTARPYTGGMLRIARLSL